MDLFLKLRHLGAPNLTNSEVTCVKKRYDEVHFRLEYTIQNLSRYCRGEGPGPGIHSAGVTMAGLELHQFKGRWRLAVWPIHKIPAKDNRTETTYLGAALQLVDEESNSVKFTGDEQWEVRYKISLYTGKWRKTSISETSTISGARFGSAQFTRGFPTLCPHDYLFGTPEKAGVVKDDTITIVIKVVVEPQRDCVVRINYISKSVPRKMVDADEKRGPDSDNLRIPDQSAASSGTVCPSCNDKDFSIDRVTASLVLVILRLGNSTGKTMGNGEMRDEDILINFLRNGDNGQLDKETANRLHEIIRIHHENLHSFYGIQTTASQSTLPTNQHPIGNGNIVSITRISIS